MSCGTEGVKIEPMDVYIGEDQAQVEKITCVESTVAASLNNKYFLLYDGTTRFYVWMNVNATGTDPALTGYTGIEVSLGANPQTAAQVATAVKTAVDAEAEFTATVSGNIVTVTHVANGYNAFAHDSQAAKTGFAFGVTTVGDLFEKIGLLDGDISITGLSRNPVDITAHQKGASVLGQIFTSSGNPEISFSLKEVSLDKYSKILRYAGGKFLPVANGSTEVIGGGSYGLFQSPKFTKIVMHPVRLGLADKSNDYCFWKCTIDLDTLTFSGENILTLPVNAKAFEDCDKTPGISTWMYGDWSQPVNV